MKKIYEVVYIMQNEKLTVHRKMNQKDLGMLLLENNIRLLSVNSNDSITYRKRR